MIRKLSSCKSCSINSQANSLGINLSVELCPIILLQISLIAVEKVTLTERIPEIFRRSHLLKETDSATKYYECCANCFPFEIHLMSQGPPPFYEG